MAAHTLQVSILEAKGLKHMNMTGDAPYCVCEVKPSSGKASHPARCQTAAIPKTLDPVWNETHDLDPWHIGDSLEFTVYDKGLIGSKTEGKAVLPSEYIYPHGFEGEVPIEGLPHAMLHVRVVPHVPFEEEGGEGGVHGEMLEPHTNEAHYSEAHVASHALQPTEPMKLQVTVLSARGLKHMNMVGDSPYCVCEVLHKAHTAKPSKFQTKTLSKTLEPSWNETHELDPWHADEAIQFTIFDKGLVGSKTEGQATLSPEHFYPHGCEAELPISGLHDAVLHVQVVPVGPSDVEPGHTTTASEQHTRAPTDIAHETGQTYSVPFEGEAHDHGAYGAELHAEGPPMELEITIHQATGLKHLNMLGDKIGCECRVQHADGRANIAKCETKQIKSLEPVWNETHSVDPWRAGEALEFIVQDHGVIGSKTEGKAILPSEYFFPNGFEGDVPIEGLPHAMLSVRVVPVGASREGHEEAHVMHTQDAHVMQTQEAHVTQTQEHAEPEIHAEGPPQKLEVSIIQATGLKHLNFTGDSMFCVCEVLHADKKQKSTKIETKQVKKSLDPLWNEVHEVDPWRNGEPLEFTVYDHGLVGSKTEGKALLPSEYFYPNGFEGDVPIQGLQHATLHVRVLPVGASTVGQVHHEENHEQHERAAPAPAHSEAPPVVHAEGPPQRLQVTMIQATGLKHLNFVGDSMFCVCEVHHADKKAKPTKCETKRIAKTLEPEWNEMHELDPWRNGEPLEFTVYDHGMIGSKTEGKAVLPSEYFYPNGFEGDVPIEGLAEAMLYVRVLPVGPSLADQAQGATHSKVKDHDQNELQAETTVAQRSIAPPSELAHQPAQSQAHTIPAVHAEGPPQKLQVSIIQATGLKHLNFVGDSMFCVCEVHHAEKKAKATKCETKRVAKSLDPVWDETHELDPWRSGEPLEFTVYDHGMVGSKTEGKAHLPSEYFYPNGFEGEVPIEGLQHAMLHVRVLPAGPSMDGQAQHAQVHQQVGTRAAPPEPAHPPAQTYAEPLPAAVHAEGPPQKLEVTVIQAMGLKHLNMTGDNMFCVCSVDHAEKKGKATNFQTKKVAKSLDPLWNETHELDPWHNGEPLEFMIYDHGMIGSKKEGKAVLPSEYFYPDGFEGDIPIDGLSHALLHVRVVPAGQSTHGQTSARAHAPTQEQAPSQVAAQTHVSSTGQAAPAIHAEGPPQKLKVSIVQASGMHHMNFTGDNLYCQAQVLHADKKTKAAKCLTKTIPKSLEPVWNETHELEPWHVGEPVEFTIYDKGMLSSKTEGKALLPSEYIYPNGFEGDIPVEGVPNAMVHVRVLPAGPAGSTTPPTHVQAAAPAQVPAAAQPAPAQPAVQPAIQPAIQQTSYQTQQQQQRAEGPAQRLEVSIYKATGLKHLNFTGDNFYCVCEAHHADRHAKATKVQTKVVSKSLDPEWNETQVLDPWHAGDDLHFTIYDHGMIGSKTEGKAVLPSDYILPSGFEGDVPIDGLHEAMVHVRVSLLGLSSARDGHANASHAQQAQAARPGQSCAQQAQVQQAQTSLVGQHVKTSATSAEKLQVTVIQATGLKHLNFVGDNMYCTINVQHKDKGARHETYETKKIQKSLEPKWNETHEIDPWHAGEALEFNIYDKGLLNSKTEGKAVLPAEYFVPNGFEGDVPINGLPHAMLHVRVLPAGASTKTGKAQQLATTHHTSAPQQQQQTAYQLTSNYTTGHHQPGLQQGFGISEQTQTRLQPLQPVSFTQPSYLQNTTIQQSNFQQSNFQQSNFQQSVSSGGRVQPTGAQKLQVSLIRAKGLEHLGLRGELAYCECKTPNPDERVKPATCQTKQCRNQLDPVWEEVFDLEWYVGQPLYFSVYDRSMQGSNFEAKTVRLMSDQFYPQGFMGDLPIMEVPYSLLTVKIVPLKVGSIPMNGPEVRYVSGGAVAPIGFQGATTMQVQPARPLVYTQANTRPAYPADSRIAQEPNDLFSRIDTNHDGVIDREEMTNAAIGRVPTIQSAVPAVQSAVRYAPAAPSSSSFRTGAAYPGSPTAAGVPQQLLAQQMMQPSSSSSQGPTQTLMKSLTSLPPQATYLTAGVQAAPLGPSTLPMSQHYQQQLTTVGGQISSSGQAVQYQGTPSWVPPPSQLRVYPTQMRPAPVQQVAPSYQAARPGFAQGTSSQLTAGGIPAPKTSAVVTQAAQVMYPGQRHAAAPHVVQASTSRSTPATYIQPQGAQGLSCSYVPPLGVAQPPTYTPPIMNTQQPTIFVRP
eukprot:TRINITY_DN1001_c0_g1_i2.p1 TRINITY_DN1001_c0_g1~~TRINITY_DN1001_c0_g1_i2.p1  ORF type:complete len:2239 (+),score=295.82 TRINITY_DN1001_c0_g1_i2:60-6719(+)